MSNDSSLSPTIAELRSIARAQGVEPTDADLEAVRGFLATIVPAMRVVEEETSRDVPPAGLYLPGEE